MRRIIFALAITAAIGSCTKDQAAQEVKFEDRTKYLGVVNYHDLKGWYSDDHQLAFHGFLNSCKVINKLPNDKSKATEILKSDAADWQEICDIAQDIVTKNQKKKIGDDGELDYLKTNLVGGEEARIFFEEQFIPFKVKMGKKDKGLFTGYYLIGLNGSYTKDSRYKYPIYNMPNDLEKGKQYYSREEIENGVLENKGLEIVWVDNKVDLFFLHIQGSGKIFFEDGSEIKVGYAGSNGRSYYAVGKTLIENKAVKRKHMSAQAIKKWLHDNPEKADDLMNENASYVFFRNLGTKGVVGAEGSVISPKRSIAVDSRYLPYGMPIWLDTNIPNINGDNKGDPFLKLMIAQDRGGAIKGLIRGDIFFGFGKSAEEISGYMKNEGKLHFLIPNNIALKNGII